VPVIAHFAKHGNASNARAALGTLPLRANVIELPLLYPVTTEIDRHDPCYKEKIGAFYETAAEAVAMHLDAGRDVAVLSEGDPLFYGSYMHLHTRLAPRYATGVIPGLTSMSGAWSVAGAPIAQGDDVLAVLPGTLPEEELARRLMGVEAAVILKLGRHLPRVRRAIEAAGRMEGALYVERATCADGRTERLALRDDRPAPYFSLILVPGWR
jgi:precorrin-2/cobalt-factor-2 C20-methyltransferase